MRGRENGPITKPIAFDHSDVGRHLELVGIPRSQRQAPYKPIEGLELMVHQVATHPPEVMSTRRREIDQRISILGRRMNQGLVVSGYLIERPHPETRHLMVLVHLKGRKQTPWGSYNMLLDVTRQKKYERLSLPVPEDLLVRVHLQHISVNRVVELGPHRVPSESEVNPNFTQPHRMRRRLSRINRLKYPFVHRVTRPLRINPLSDVRRRPITRVHKRVSQRSNLQIHLRQIDAFSPYHRIRPRLARHLIRHLHPSTHR